MALHTTLPVYKVAYDLLILITEIVKNMNKHFKRSIGEKLSAEIVEIMMLIFRANVAKAKEVPLTELIGRLQVTELLLRLSSDMRLISITQYAKAIELTSLVGKQVGGWRRSALSPAA